MPHEWVGAATVLLPPQQAAQAEKSGKVRFTSPVQIEVLDVYCQRCRRAYAALQTNGMMSDCQIGSQHIGGPRKQPDPLTLAEQNGWPEPHDPLMLQPDGGWPEPNDPLL
jgi:hypothetical protein